MSHRDLKEGCVRLNSCDLRVALKWLLRGIDWSPIKLRRDCTWTASLLATTALLWAWSDELTLIDRFVAVRRIVLHLFPQTWEVANTYQGFIKILRRRTTELVEEPLVENAIEWPSASLMVLIGEEAFAYQ